MELRRTMIFAKDLDRMTAFYRDGLGLRLLPERRQEGWVEFDAGGCLLVLHAIPAQIAKDIEITSPPRPRSDTPLKLVFETPDLEAARTHLLSQGAVMQQPRGSGACDGLDPEGNVFQIVKVVPRSG
ncbi:MAG TPA: VOC family protein [Polyangia bacterium]|nr:VOC family protein [Polyangia bacterium]